MASMNNTTSEETLNLERALFLAGRIAEVSRTCDNSEAWKQKRLLMDRARSFLRESQKRQEIRQENQPDYDDDPAEAKAIEVLEDVLSRQYLRY